MVEFCISLIMCIEYYQSVRLTDMFEVAKLVGENRAFLNFKIAAASLIEFSTILTFQCAYLGWTNM